MSYTGWDDLVLSHPGYTIFHSAAWAKVLDRTYGHRPVYFGQVEDGHLKALLPVMEVNSWLLGRRGVSLPFADFCEPLVVDEAGFSRLLRAAFEHGRSRGWNYLEWRGGNRPADASPSITVLGHIVDLAGNEEELFARLESSVRRAIRKAEKSGVEVHFLNHLEAVRAYYRLHCLTRRRHGLPPQPFAFFKNIQEHMLAQGFGFVALAYISELRSPPPPPMAGAIFLHFGKKALYKFGASDERFQERRANNLVMWRAIQRFRANGLQSLHLGRASLGQEGLRRYKLGWGAREHQINYFKYNLRRGVYVTARDRSTGSHNRMFRCLPLALNRLLGEAMYRHLD